MPLKSQKGLQARIERVQGKFDETVETVSVFASLQRMRAASGPRGAVSVLLLRGVCRVMACGA